MRGTFPDNANPDQAMWCMCSHHACYHDEAQPGQVPVATVDAVAGQENERPKANREPLSPVQDMASFHMPAMLGTSLDLDMLGFPASFSCHQSDAANLHQGAAANSGQDNSMPDTLNWGDLIQPQTGQVDALPPIPPQCLMPSQPPSTASSSQARYLRPFAGKGLQTLSGASASRPLDIVLERGTDPIPCVGNSKERAQELNFNNQRMPTKLPHYAAGTATPASDLTQELEPGISSSTAKGLSREDFQHLSNTVQGHEQRLDRLENVSFSAAGHEECQDKHDHADLRVTDLESRVEEVEKILNNDTSSLGSTRRLIRTDAADDATASVVSVATNTTVTAADRSEMYSQLQSLQAQVHQLQASSSPSYNNPLELEVVLLPFPLHGIWMEAHEFPSQTQPGPPGSNAEEWTQVPNTGGRPLPDSPLPWASAAAAGQTPGSDWLLPRACAPGRMVDRRLRSRGLIKTVSIKGPDARSVQHAISTAFSDVLRVAPSNKMSRALVQRSSHDSDPRLSTILGLLQPWVPLRKLHKDSRLRFLAPSEMITPALWDVAFLVSSVVMKASGVQRLYITQREAYLQDHPIGFEAFESGWTWQKLRELTRVYPDSQSSGSFEIPEADALEECWTWNDRLDEPPSHRSSLSLRQARANRLWGRSSSSSPQQFFTGVQSPVLSSSPVALRAQSPLVSRERRGSRPPHIRTNSIPPTAPIALFPSQPKRRVSSYGNANNQPYERRPSPFLHRSSPRLPVTTPANSSSIIKRRQSTRSPSLIPRNTPRWSRASMSRSPSLAPIGPAFGDDRGERRTTPFCYATPYSNAPPEPYPGHRAGSRGPILPSNAYYADGDEEMDDDRGSSTDPYDSEMTNDADVEAAAGFRDDVDPDIDVYEDEPDELDDVDTDAEDEKRPGNDASMYPSTRLQSRQLSEPEHGYGQALPLTSGTLPEDEPWPGIEDMSDGENVDPFSGETNDADVEIDGAAGLDAASEASSQPSEYPSTQRAWHVTDTAPDNRDSGVGFRIHEDGDVDITGLETQWA